MKSHLIKFAENAPQTVISEAKMNLVKGGDICAIDLIDKWGKGRPPKEDDNYISVI